VVADGEGLTNPVSHFYVNDENEKSSAEWFHNCAELLSVYSKLNMYKSNGSDTATFIGVGKVMSSGSPSGKDELMISFGGTFSAYTAIGKLAQVTEDLHITPKQLKANGTDFGYVHAGFWKALEPVLDPLFDLISFETQSNPTMSVTVTGHSLGAALATLFGAVLVAQQPDLDLHLYTFGTPRSASPTFVKALTETGMDQLRVVNQLDMISMLPTSVGLGSSLLHTGPQITLGFNNVSSDCQSYFVDSQWKALVELPAKLWSGCPWDAVQDHLQYQYHIWDWFQGHGLDDASACCANYTF
jgi:hypothetical protein